MTDTRLPSPELLCKLLRYEPETGKLFWRPRGMEFFIDVRTYRTWNTKFSNNEALTGANNSGYRHGCVLSVQVLAHRVIWAMQTGAWPTHEIDHIDRNRLNNRWVNLRHATKSQNMTNVVSRPGSSSKFLGVSWRGETQKWRVQIHIDGKNTNVGHFSCEVEAAKAYDKAAIIHYGQYASLNFLPDDASTMPEPDQAALRSHAPTEEIQTPSKADHTQGQLSFWEA